MRKTLRVVVFAAVVVFTVAAAVKGRGEHFGGPGLPVPVCNPGPNCLNN